MRGLLSDHNAGGQLARIVELLRASALAEFWAALEPGIYSFADVGLRGDSSDAAVWFLCQSRSLILVTGNRNADGEDSLEAVIRTHGHAATLPVFTIGTLDRVLQDKQYALRVGYDMLEYLTDLNDRPEKVLGSGRLYFPRSAQNRFP